MSSTAILFPGQGAQAVGMGKDLAAALPACRALYDRASEVLGFDLAAVSFEGPIEKLTISANAQPAIFVASMACWTAWKGKHPDALFAMAAGLSSGEWTALHFAGAVSFDDTLKVLEARGRFMQEACQATPGGMVSVIGADEATLQRVCKETGVETANLNSREQTVLSGPKDSVDAAEKMCKDLKIRMVVRLNVSGAFHSTLMKPAADRFGKFLAGIEFKAPSTPVVANVTGRPHGGPDAIRKAMIAQVYSPVRWYAGIEWMKEQGVSSYLECGPGKVLSGLLRRIDKGASVNNIQDLSALAEKTA